MTGSKRYFFIDKITECIEEVATGKKCLTDMQPVEKADLKTVLKKNGWHFQWKAFLQNTDRRVYKLFIKDDPDKVLQGLLSMEIMDNFIEMHRIITGEKNNFQAYAPIWWPLPVS